MGLIACVRRWRYVYGWRLRYWWLDTPSGAQAQRVACFLAVLVIVIEFAKASMDALVRRNQPQTHEAFFWWVIWLVLMVGAAVASYAMRPKAQGPVAQPGDAPSTEDGQMVVHHFGECWVDDTFILAWKVVGTDKIKSKGGKK